MTGTSPSSSSAARRAQSSAHEGCSRPLASTSASAGARDSPSGGRSVPLAATRCGLKPSSASSREVSSEPALP